MQKRSLLRACAVPVAVGAALLVAGPASAHVTISPSEGAAGAYTVLTVSVPHGCDGSPTTTVAIQMPEEILSVTPTRNPLWEVEKVMQKLDEPVTDAHGNEVTERVGQVVYTTDDPLPDGYRDAFELSLQLPDAAGETLVFPTVQTCEKGETGWVETAGEGQSEDDLEAPAPTVTLLAAEGDGHEASTAAAEEDTAEDATEPASSSEEGDSDVLPRVALAAGLLGLAAGVGALVSSRRRT